MPAVIAAMLLLQSGGVDPSEPPTVTAVRVDRAPVVDGRLDDPEWSLARAVTDFRQTDPDEGAPVSEATAVRVLYDGSAVYVGARLFDTAPSGIVRRLARRDASTHSDEFRVFLDSYHDRRTAFEFIVNAAGVKKDVLIGDDGDFDDASWDPVWEAATSVDSLGWTAEIRIPLSQLRFSKAQDQVWGAHFVRWIERKQEQALFPFIGKKENGLVSRFADLEGIRHVGSPKRLELLPYTVGRGTYLEPKDRGNPFERPSSYHSGAGADVKYGVSSSLTLDATLNPDFGQVEVDETFVNLTAFEQFLEEHRPFFVEGTEIFNFGSNGGGATNFSGRPLYFYSRRIGREPQVEPSSGDFEDMPTSTTILGAAKVSGRPAGGWSVGVLDALTARERATVFDATAGTYARDEVEPPTNYFVGRARRDLDAGNTSFGLLATAMDRWPDSPALDVLPTRAYGGGRPGAPLDEAREGLQAGQRLPAGGAQLELRRRCHRPNRQDVWVRAVQELLDGRLVALLQSAGRRRPADPRRAPRPEASLLVCERRRDDGLPRNARRVRVRVVPARRGGRLVSECHPATDLPPERRTLAQAHRRIRRGPHDGADRHEAARQHRGRDGQHPLRLRRTDPAPVLRDAARQRYVLAVPERPVVRATVHVHWRLPELQGATGPKDLRVQPLRPRQRLHHRRYAARVQNRHRAGLRGRSGRTIRVGGDAVHVPESRLSHALGQAQRGAPLGVSPGIHALRRLDTEPFGLLAV